MNNNLSYAEVTKRNIGKLDDSYLTVYRYGIFGKTQLLDTAPKLKNEEYKKIIVELRYKINEIESWMTENCGNHRNHRNNNDRYDFDFDRHSDCKKCEERTEGLSNRKAAVELFISKIQTYTSCDK